MSNDNGFDSSTSSTTGLLRHDNVERINVLTFSTESIQDTAGTLNSIFDFDTRNVTGYNATTRPIQK